MLQLLNPIWLLGIGGIVVPLIIHLWNVKTGKTLKVGSIALMGESSRQNSRSLKLNDLLLLFLRCLLIILLSVLLAEPVWRSMQMPNENRAWILVEKDAFSETYSNYKKEIDSLLNAGNELHLFQPQFEKVDFDEMMQDTVLAETLSKSSYWILIRLLEQQIPQGSKAFIFTGDRLNRFHGFRPAVNTAINWQTYTSSDSVSKWIDQAYLSSSGDIRAVISQSNPKRTLRKIVTINPGTVNSGIKASIWNGKPFLQLNNQGLAADTTTLTIGINSEGFPKHAEYLIAAINAIQKYTSRKIKLVKPSADPDILFWLSPKNIPVNIAKNMKPGSKLFQYAKGKVNSQNTWIEVSDGQTSLQSEHIALYKRITFPAINNGFAIWEDGFGQPVLHLDQENERLVYTYYSRLDPEWTDLVWSPEFVKMLMPLLIPEVHSSQHKEWDKRSIDPIQIPPNSDFRPQSSELLIVKEDNLKIYFWFLLMIVFITERFISFKNNGM